MSAREEMAMNQLIDDMGMEDRMAGIYGMDDSAGDRMLVNRNIENPMTTGFGPSAANPDVPANLFVGTPNLPPSVITGQRGEMFDTQTGNIIQSDASYFGDLGGSSASMVPPSPAEVFRAQESQRAMGLDQRQAGYDAYQAMLGNAVADAQGNIDSATGLLGAPTRFMNQMFIDGMNTRIGGRDSAAYQNYLNDPNLFSPVYNTAGRLTGYRDQFNRLTGTDPINNLVTEDPTSAQKRSLPLLWQRHRAAQRVMCLTKDCRRVASRQTAMRIPPPPLPRLMLAMFTTVKLRLMPRLQTYQRTLTLMRRTVVSLSHMATVLCSIKTRWTQPALPSWSDARGKTEARRRACSQGRGSAS